MAKKIATAATSTNQTEGTEMTNATQATATETTNVDTTATAPAATEPAAPKAEKPTPKYIIQRNKRQRFSFGNTWINAVLAGVVSDHAKLVAHGVKLNAGTKEDLEKLDIEALLPIVQKAIMEEPAPTTEPTADTATTTEPAAETTDPVVAETPAEQPAEALEVA